MKDHAACLVVIYIVLVAIVHQIRSTVLTATQTVLYLNRKEKCFLTTIIDASNRETG